MELGTAFHEAGHAVACLRLGRKFAYVTIVSQGDTAGHLRHWRARRFASGEIRMLGFMRFPEWIDQRLMISMAGEIAQKKGAPKSYRRHHAGGDWTGVDDFFWATGLAGWKEYIPYCLARLQFMCADPATWAGVSALAEELIHHRKLDYAQAEKVFRSAEERFMKVKNVPVDR